MRALLPQCNFSLLTRKRVEEETGPIKETITHIEDKRKDLIKEKSTIESVRDIINEDKEIGKERYGKRNTRKT